MRRELAFALLALLLIPFAVAQQTIPPSSPPGAIVPTGQAEPADNVPSGPYKVGGPISNPVVLHSVVAEFSDEARRAHYQGVCIVSLIVDAQGKPQNLHVVRALGMGLDEKAIEAIRQYKFKPAMKDGTTPVPVQIMIEVDFRLYEKGSRPESIPVDAPNFDNVPANVRPPFLIRYVKPKYSRSAEKNRVRGECVIDLTVDTRGVPQNVHVVTSLDPSLDENAVNAVRKWRYSPAIVNGNETPFESTIKIKFVSSQ